MSDEDLRKLERDVSAGDAQKAAKLRRARCRAGKCCAHAGGGGEAPGTRLIDGGIAFVAWVIVRTPKRGLPWVIAQWTRNAKWLAVKAACTDMAMDWDALRGEGFSVVKAIGTVRGMAPVRRPARARRLNPLPSRGSISGRARAESEG